MALTGSSIATTYLKLLRANSDTMGADATASYIQDSADTDSALSISTTRVGIGTASPYGTLHVKNASAGSIVIETASDSVGVESTLFFRTVNEASNTKTKGAIIFEKTHGSGVGKLHLCVDGAEDAGNVVLADSKMAIDKDGNVGIGVGSPTSGKKITLKEHASHSAAIQFMDTDGSLMGNVGLNRTAGTLLSGSSSEALVFTSTYGGSPLQLGTADTVRLTISIAGNIGIGDTSPSHKLDVAGGIVEQGGALKENLLTNSGFDVWSNSTLANVGSNLITGWSNAATPYDTLTTSGADISEATEISSFSLSYANSNAVTLTSGKLYKIVATLADHSGSFPSMVTATAGHSNQRDLGTLAVGTNTIVFEADSGGYDDAEIRIYNSASATSWSCTFTLYEVTPGIVGGALTFDGGWKDSTLSIYREHNHTSQTTTKNGSFYSLKVVAGSASIEEVIMNVSGGILTAQRFAGRTVTFGCWVYSVSAADNVKLRMHDGATATFSDHIAADSWIWTEITATVDSTNPSEFRVGWSFDGDSADVAYISQPMLVYGSSIGSGNYTRPQGEMVYGEATYDLTGFAGTAFSDVGSATDINLEATSNGRIPKGAKAIYYRLGVADSDVSTGSPFFELYGIHETTGDRILFDSLGGAEWDDKLIEHMNWLPCNSTGDVSYTAGASGSSTLDVRLRIMGVQLR